MNTSFRFFLIAVVVISGWATGCQVPTASPRPNVVPPNSETVSQQMETNPRNEVPKDGTQGNGLIKTSYSDTSSGGTRPVCATTGISCGASPADLSDMGSRDVFREDRRDFFPMLGRDFKGLVNWRDAALTGAALGGALAVRQDIDFEVRHYVEEHPMRWSHSSKMLGYVGEVQYQVPVLLGVYGYSLYSEDDELHELSKAILSTYTITGLTTLSIKAIADTERPSQEWNDGQFGFPSFHTSSSFSVAAVVDEYCGLPTALPVYALSGLIGWSRIDEQDHDLSDVVFGAALGYIIGKSVARQHKNRHSKMRLSPYQHPLEPAGGIAAEWRY